MGNTSVMILSYLGLVSIALECTLNLIIDFYLVVYCSEG